MTEPLDAGLLGGAQVLRNDELRVRRVADPAAVPLLRRQVRRWLGTVGVDEDTAESVLLAADEAVTNAVEHAYGCGPPGSLGLVVSATPGGGVEVEVSDEGRWRPVPADPGFRGRGLPMIHTLATNVEVARGPHGTTVRMCWDSGTLTGHTHPGWPTAPPSASPAST